MTKIYPKKRVRHPCIDWSRIGLIIPLETLLDFQVRRPVAVAPQLQQGAAASETDDDDEEPDREADEDYDNEVNKEVDRPKKSLKPLKIPKKKQTQQTGDEETPAPRRRRRRDKAPADTAEEQAAPEVELTGEERTRFWTLHFVSCRRLTFASKCGSTSLHRRLKLLPAPDGLPVPRSAKRATKMWVHFVYSLVSTFST